GEGLGGQVPQSRGPREIEDFVGWEIVGLRRGPQRPHSALGERGPQTRGPREIKDFVGWETRGPREIKDFVGWETRGPREIKDFVGWETRGPQEIAVVGCGFSGVGWGAWSPKIRRQFGINHPGMRAPGIMSRCFPTSLPATMGSSSPRDVRSRRPSSPTLASTWFTRSSLDRCHSARAWTWLGGKSRPPAALRLPSQRSSFASQSPSAGTALTP